MSDITLESLIQEHKDRIAQLKYKPSPQGCIGFGYYYYDNSESYQRWLATTKRFIGIMYPNDKDVNEFESISKEKLGPEQQKRFLAILEAFAALPTVIPDNRTMQITGKKGNGKSAPFPALNLSADSSCMCHRNDLLESDTTDYYVLEARPGIWHYVGIFLVVSSIYLG